MPRRAPLLVAVLSLSLTACLNTGPHTGTPVGIILMNARSTGSGFTTYPTANFYRANNVTLSSAGAASDSCQLAPYAAATGATDAIAIGAGTGVAISVSGRTDTLRKTSASDLTYRLSSASGLAFTPGDSAFFTIAGDVAGFVATSVHAKTAEAFSASALAVPPAGQDLPVTWSQPNDANGAMVVSLRYNDPLASGTGLNVQIYCDFHDKGTGTIPAALVAKWAGSSMRETLMQRLRTMIWQDPNSSQYVNVVSTFEIPTPLSP
ncbi:MAG: hypothetical protein HYR75_07285 [Gemmatimonadetes bacterium]|nr:hypothetical protein [Gemmatimonadota bacterium]MBI3566950.1 hypothetical protein [Gemmatimonadota bacterium]